MLRLISLSGSSIFAWLTWGDSGPSAKSGCIGADYGLVWFCSCFPLLTVSYISFQEVTAIIFCVSLAEYNLKLMEDRTTNRMQESLRLFRQIVNTNWFKESDVILFLNKSDLFQEKVRWCCVFFVVVFVVVFFFLTRHIRFGVYPSRAFSLPTMGLRRLRRAPSTFSNSFLPNVKISARRFILTSPAQRTLR